MQRSKRPAGKSETARVLRLCDDVSLRRLEEFYVYNKSTDELYEIDETASGFLKGCNGEDIRHVSEDDAEFIDYCIDEGILEELKEPGIKRVIEVYSCELTPSLRYLELLITDRCNLKCRHCYIENPRRADLPLHDIESVFGQFEQLGGMRLIITGGEPVLHKYFSAINGLIAGYDFRSILLTNGTLMDKSLIDTLNFHEVQLSIDGLQDTHDLIRGAGTFKKTMDSASALIEGGIDVSVATMILKKNVDELEELNKLLIKVGIKKWAVDVPCATKDDGIFLDYKTAGRSFKYGFSSGGLGSGLYNSADGYACGAHLMTVMSDGTICKCSFFADNPAGNIRDGLERGFARLKKIKLDELECDCDHIEECRGGCRYRAYLAGGIEKADEAKCGFYL